MYLYVIEQNELELELKQILPSFSSFCKELFAKDLLRLRSMDLREEMNTEQTHTKSQEILT